MDSGLVDFYGIFKYSLLSVTSPLCSIMNKYIDIIISQNTTQFMYICTIYFTTTCFGPSLGHLQVVP